MPGEGSVFRRTSDGAWISQLSTGPRGHRRYVSRSSRTRAEAVRKLVELQAEVDGRSVRATTMLTGDYLERWVSDARNIRPTTRAGYRTVIAHHLEPAVGHIPLRNLTPIDVERLLAETNVSPKYLRNIHAALRRALGQAVRQGLISRNVASREFVDAPDVELAEPEALTEDELERLLAVHHPLQPLVTLAADTGLRQGELLGLAWEDIAGDRVHVRLELVYRDGAYHRDPLKTRRSRRTVPLTERAMAAIAHQREVVTAAGFVPISTGPVFISRKGTALSGSWVTHRFYDVCEAAGIARRPFKILRATYGSRLYDAGVPDRTIADLMGHTTTKTTHRHYIHSRPDQLVAAVARLNQSPVTDSVSGQES